MNGFYIAIVAALSAALTSTIAPILLAVIAYRQRRQEKFDEYTRQDQVAARVEDAARKLLQRQDEVAAKAAEAAKLLLANNERVAADAEKANAKLDVIHTLVNSNMTAALQSEMDATTRELAMMREVVELKRAAGSDPTTEVLAAIEATKMKLGELAATLADRLAANEQAKKI